MDTGRKLSWLEQQDVERFLTDFPGKPLFDAWGAAWFWHIAMLADETLGLADIQSATHL